MVNPQPGVNLADFVTAPAGMEVLRYSFYNRKAFSAAAFPASTQFFSDQIGVGAVNSRGTNMTKGSAIGNPRRFLIQFINCAVYNVATAEVILVDAAQDIQQVLMQTVIRCELLDKEYLTVPTYVVPAGGGMTGNGGGTLAGPVFVNNGVPDKRNAYPVELPLEREASFNFTLLAPTAFTISKALYVEIILTGLLLRPRQ